MFIEGFEKVAAAVAGSWGARAGSWLKENTDKFNKWNTETGPKKQFSDFLTNVGAKDEKGALKPIHRGWLAGGVGTAGLGAGYMLGRRKGSDSQRD